MAGNVNSEQKTAAAVHAERVHAAIMAAPSFGLSVIQLIPGTKKPKNKWKAHQQRAQTPDELRAWANGVRSFGVVCGAVSGNLEVLDFDANEKAQPRPYTAEDFFNPWMDACGDLVDQYQLPIVRTGGGGYQILYRCETIGGNRDLAWVPDENPKNEAGRAIAIETRGEGGFFVAAPSLHPDGGYYEFMCGDLSAIPTIPAGVREQFFKVAQSLCLMPYERKTIQKALQNQREHQERTTPVNSAAGDVIGQFNERNSIRALLLRNGYTDCGHGRLSRPGKGDSGGVAVLDSDNVSFHWSTNDPLYATNGQNSPLPWTPFGVFCELEHAGDLKAAVRAAALELGIAYEQQPPAQPERTPEQAAQVVVVASEDDDEPDEHSPLDRKPYFVETGWIGNYVELTHELIGSPREINQLAALVLASTVIQRRAWLPMAWGDVWANQYACIVFPTSFFHKSTSIKFTTELLQRANLLKLQLPNQFTPEGLFASMEDAPAGVVVRDEIGMLFASNSVKYQQELKPLLTDIYDCGPQRKRLSKVEITINHPYLNILGATTPEAFYESLQTRDWYDGFFQRWLFTVQTSDPDFDHVAAMRSEKHIERINRLASGLAWIDKQPEKPFKLVGDSWEMWQDWQKGNLREAYAYGDSRVNGFVTRYNTIALKLSITLAALADSWGFISNEHMQTAINLADGYKYYLKRILEERGDHDVTGSDMQKIFALIKSKGGAEGLRKGELQRFANMKKQKAEPVIDELVKIGAIVEMAAPGRRGARYKAVVDKLPIKHWK